MSIEHTDAYRATFERTSSNGHAQYMLASLALHEAVTQTNHGIEPTTAILDGVGHRLEEASASNERRDWLVYYRSKLLRAYMKPIIWASVLNYEALSNSEARNAARKLDIEQAHNDAIAIAAEALDKYRQLGTHTAATAAQRATIKGYLNEATPTLLGGRARTVKLLALPSMAYDDQLSPEKHAHYDGILFDNRKNRLRSRFPYQVKTLQGTDGYQAFGIPVINARDLGNMHKSSRWPQDDDEFMTVEHIIAEHNGDADAKTVSTLNSIWSHVSNKIMRP